MVAINGNRKDEGSIRLPGTNERHVTVNELKSPFETHQRRRGGGKLFKIPLTQEALLFLLELKDSLRKFPSRFPFRLVSRSHVTGRSVSGVEFTTPFADRRPG